MVSAISLHDGVSKSWHNINKTLNNVFFSRWMFNCPARPQVDESLFSGHSAFGQPTSDGRRRMTGKVNQEILCATNLVATFSQPRATFATHLPSSREDDSMVLRSGSPSVVLPFSQLSVDALCTARKTFLCPVCSLECPDKAQFRRHYMTHSGERPFGCHLCTYRCIRKGDLQYHISRKHQDLLYHSAQ